MTSSNRDPYTDFEYMDIQVSGILLSAGATLRGVTYNEEERLKYSPDTKLQKAFIDIANQVRLPTILIPKSQKERTITNSHNCVRINTIEEGGVYIYNDEYVFVIAVELSPFIKDNISIYFRHITDFGLFYGNLQTATFPRGQETSRFKVVSNAVVTTYTRITFPENTILDEIRETFPKRTGETPTHRSGAKTFKLSNQGERQGEKDRTLGEGTND